VSMLSLVAIPRRFARLPVTPASVICLMVVADDLAKRPLLHYS